MNPMWHFPFMILASFVLFFIVLRLVLSAEEFSQKKNNFLSLAYCYNYGNADRKIWCPVELPIVDILSNTHVDECVLTTIFLKNEC